MEKKHYDWFNYGSLIVITILLALMIFKAVPAEWYMPILIIGIALMIVRIIIRINMAKQLRNKDRS